MPNAYRNVMLIYRGYAFYKMKKYNDAKRCFNLLTPPNSKSSYFSTKYIYIGYCHYYSKEYSQAYTDFNKVYTTSDTSSATKANALYYMASVKRNQGKKAEAIKLYQKVIANPKSASWQKNSAKKTIAALKKQVKKK
ncbi:MAG: tetratricopeptide repeat protein [Lentisphaerae bacterium]|nr:tetratricopeptide repeat protein [Lentisphaerota bacterium]MCP4101315.1 tetratricopeptide repeat protein [Lentisphaerota bacterium]